MKFSVIIPTYNRAVLIGKTIETALGQCYKDFELIIIDDGSTDDTEAVVKGYNDKRIIYIRIENGERGAARNYGISIAKGDYVTFLDSDDLLFEFHLEEAKDVIATNNSPYWLHLGYCIQTPEGKTVKVVDNLNAGINKLLITGNYLSCIGVFIRRDVAIENQFNENRELAAMEDWELWLRMAVKYPLCISNRITSIIVDHESRSVVQLNKDKLINRVELLIQLITSNKEIVAFYSNDINKFLCSCYTYASIHLALTKKHRSDSIRYLLKGLKEHPLFVFQRRFLAIIKHNII